MSHQDDYEEDIRKTIAFIYTHQMTHYSDLVDNLKVSRKKIAAYLDEIDRRLLGSKVQLVRKRNQGIYFEGDTEQIAEIFHIPSNYDGLDVHGRRSIITLNLIMQNSFVKMDNLADDYFVSRSTLERDLRAIKREVSKFGLSVSSTVNGIAIVGNEQDKRNYASRIISNYWRESIKANRLVVHLPQDFDNLIGSETLRTAQAVLSELQRVTKIEFTEYQYQSLLIHICISTVRIQNAEYLPIWSSASQALSPETSILTRLLEEAFNIQVPKSEQEYLNIHILAAKQSKLTPDDFKGQVVNRRLLNIADFLKTNIQIYDDQLINDLTIHLGPAMHRFQVGLQASNPYTSEIMRLYPQAFELAFDLSRKLDDRYLVTVDKNEIAYLALHFQSFMERTTKATVSKNKINVAVICSTGLGTARLLTQRLKASFADKINITRVLSVPNAFKAKFVEDMIISTIPLELPGQKVVVIKPLFEPKEERLVAKEITNIEDRRTRNQNSFLSLMSPTRILVSSKHLERDDAIKMIGQLLVDRDLAKIGVAESAIAREEVASTLIRQDQVAMPHAQSEYIKKSGITLLVATHGVTWGDGEAKFVFFIGLNQHAIKNTNLDAVYHRFNQLVSSDDALSLLAKANNPKAIWHQLIDFFQKRTVSD